MRAFLYARLFWLYFRRTWSHPASRWVFLFHLTCALMFATALRHIGLNP